jgi:hypothetical protein
MPDDGSVRGTGLGTRLIGALTRSRGAELGYEPMRPGRRCRARARAEHGHRAGRLE